MKERRGSNKLKQKQMQTKLLEQSTKKMEDRLTELKRQIQEQKRARAQLGLDNTLTRWQKTNKPTVSLKSYAKQVLEQQKQVQAQFGINQKQITGTKSFQGVLKQIKSQKQQQQERNPTKIATFLKQPQNLKQQKFEQTVNNNFLKAKMNVTTLIKQKTLQQFLQQQFISQYLPIFQRQGILQLQHLRYVSKQQLMQMGVKAGHQVKILKKIKEQYDKILNGKKQQPKIVQNNQKVQFGYGEGDVNTYSKQQVYEPQNIEKQDKLSQNQYDQENNDYVEVIPIQTNEISLQYDGQQQKRNCFQCYVSIQIPQFYYDQKFFCCEICMQKYLSNLRKICPNCNMSFIKTSGYHEKGNWYCSIGCCPNHDEIQQMFLNWHMKQK